MISKPDPDAPLSLLVALALVVTLAVINLAGLTARTPFTSVDNLSKFGYDFNDFRRAARNLLAGEDPWSEIRFVTPPLSAVIAVPFAEVHPRNARSIFFAVNAACLTLGVFLYKSALFPAHREPRLTFALLMAALFSYPVAFLLHRGNIDGLVFLLVAFGIRLSSSPPGVWRDVLAAVAFAVAVNLKLYPVVILLPICIAHRWRLAGSTLASAVVVAALTPGLWQAYLGHLQSRLEIFHLQENASLLNTLIPILVLPNHLTLNLRFLYDLEALTIIAGALYAMLLIMSAALDLRLARRPNAPNFAVLATFYLPFMVMVPRLAYHYVLVHLLASVVLVHWLQTRAHRSVRAYVVSMSVGVVLSQTQAMALYLVTGNPLAHFIPGAGVLLLVVAGLLLKFKMAGDLQLQPT